MGLSAGDPSTMPRTSRVVLKSASMMMSVGRSAVLVADERVLDDDLAAAAADVLDVRTECSYEE
jgi:hypothetical protein